MDEAKRLDTSDMMGDQIKMMREQLKMPNMQKHMHNPICAKEENTSKNIKPLFSGFFIDLILHFRIFFSDIKLRHFPMIFYCQSSYGYN
jgi:hypothetical protein